MLNIAKGTTELVVDINIISMFLTCGATLTYNTGLNHLPEQTKFSDLLLMDSVRV